MNEVDWQAGSDPAAMIEYLDGKTSERKLRLFACACVRRCWDRLRYAVPREAVQTAERYAEGESSDAALENVRQQAETSWMAAPEFDMPAYQAAWATTLEPAIEAARQSRECVRQQAVRDAAYEVPHGQDEARYNAAESARECGQQCELVRELFGNPFRPVTIDRNWLACDGGSAGAILQLIWEEQRFAELPYLADALTDAGCADEALLRHLRQPAGHVRGCWAVDALLGRE